jgi:PKD repeat protein
VLHKLRDLAILLAALAWSASAAAAPQVSLVVSRSSGVAPLAVHFDTVGTTAPGLDGFADLGYAWDFGDPNAGAWAYSGQPKSRETGPIAAHVYESPGTYTASLTVTDPSGASVTVSRSITVSNPDTVYSGANTICASASGNWSGCPSGARQITTSSFESALGNVNAGQRLLFRRGDAFQCQIAATVNKAGPGTVGAYGTGASPRISVGGSALRLSGSPASFDDWRFMDLSFTGPGVAGSILIESRGRVQRLLVLRVTASSFHTHVLLNHQTVSNLNQPMHDEVYVVDSQLTDLTGGSGGNGVYMSANRMVVVGTRIENAEDVEHVARFPYAGHSLIAHNYLAHPAPTKHVIKLHALAQTHAYTFPERDTQYVVISDNEITSRINQGNVYVAPQDIYKDERLHDVLVERNYFHPGPDGYTELWVSAANVTVRDNVFDLSKGGSKGVHVTQRGIEPPPVNVDVYNNTCYGGSQAVDCVRFNAGTGHSAFNNLAVGPAGSTVMSGTATSGNNVMLASSPFVAASPATVADFQIDPSKGSALIDAGTTIAAAPRDSLFVARPVDGNNDGVAKWDIGAFEAGGGGGGTPPPPPPPPATAPAAPVLLAP